MAWYEIDSWEITGAAAAWASKGYENIANGLDELVNRAGTLAQQQTRTAVDNFEMAKAWDKVTRALSDELSLAQQQLGNQVISQRLDATKSALGNVDWLKDFANDTQAASDNIRTIGKNLGAMIGAAELLWEIKDPNVTSFEAGSTAVGVLAGVLVGAALVTAPVLVTVSAGVVAAMAAKALWENYIAPELLGLTPESSTNFWDDFGRTIDSIANLVNDNFTAKTTGSGLAMKHSTR